LAPAAALALLRELPDDAVAGLLENMDSSAAVSILAQAGERCEAWLRPMNRATAAEFRALLEYPEDSVGQLMNPAIIAFNKGTTAGQALAQLRQQKVQRLPHLFLLN